MQKGSSVSDPLIRLLSVRSKKSQTGEADDKVFKPRLSSIAKAHLGQAARLASFGGLLGLGSGLFIALSDFGALWLWLPLWKDRFWLFFRFLVTHPPLGVVAGITLALLALGVKLLAEKTAEAFARGDRERASRITAALIAPMITAIASPFVAWVARLLFTGGKMSKLPQSVALEIITAIVLVIGLWMALALARRLFDFIIQTKARVASLAYAGLFLLFLSLSKIDQLVLPTQYPYLHTVLTASCWLIPAYLLAAVALRSRWRARFEKRLSFVGIATAVVSGWVLFWNLSTLDENQNVRVALMDPRASHTRSVMLAIQPLLFGVETGGRDGSSTAAARKARALRQRQNQTGELQALPEAHVFLISIDALRADHLGTYGYSRPTSPYLDQLANESIVFERAYTQVPHSSYSISSIMTSEYLHETLALGHSLPKKTVATAFNHASYHTAAFYTLGIFHTEGARLKLYEENAYGFALHDHTDRDAGAMTDRVLKEIDRTVSRGEPSSFFWVHYFNVHEPYRATTFGDSDLDRYDSEIREADAAVKRLIEQAQKRLKRDIIVCITADHGEEFREHGGVYHGSSLYDEQVRVPLIFHVPGFAPGRVQAPVKLVDVAPTLLSLADVSVPSSMRGDDLRPLMLRITKSVGPAFSAVTHKRMVVSWPYKLIADLRFNLYELYDLSTDRFERHNLADSNRHLLESLRGEIYAFLDTLSAESKKEPDIRLAALNRGKLGDRRAVKPLSDILHDQRASNELRIQATRILGNLSDPQATQSLLEALHSSEKLISAEAAIALGRLFDQRALHALRGLVVSEDPDIRSRAAVSLARLRDRAAVPGLIDALWVAPNEYERQEAVRWLGRLRDSRALEPLINLLPELRTRYLVVVAMGQIGDKRAFEPLADVLSWDAHPNVRDNVIRGLGMLGDTRAIDLILPIAVKDPTLKNSSESLIRLNAIGLKAIGGTDGLKERLKATGFRRCYEGPLLHDWDYLHRTWCETSRESAALRLVVPRTVSDAAHGSVAVLAVRRTDSSKPTQLRLSIGRTDFEPVQVDGGWQEYRWPVEAGILSSGKATARIKSTDRGARFAVDHLLVYPRDHEKKPQHGG
ncbi:MAG: sulfatase-like hydrolase/transferase [Deltaproteobacteria bacterium]|nr:sulfatase-like hydrolase/transferase [Deltaproteobacteria bacterium]